MHNILNLIEFLFGTDLRHWLEEEANYLHTRARRIVYLLIALALLGIGINLFNVRTVNLYIGVILNIIAVLVITRPKILLVIFSVGAATSQSSIRPSQIIKNGVKGGEELLIKAAQGVGVFFIFFSFFFLAAGTLNFRNNLGAIPLVVLSIIILLLIGRAGWFKIGFYKKFIFTYTLIALIIGIGSFIPRSGYIKTIGFYPYAYLQVNAMEDGVSRVEEAIRRKAYATDAEKLVAIERKINNNQAPTNEEQSFFNRKQQERNSGKLIKQLTQFTNVFSSTAEASGNMVEIRPFILPARSNMVLNSGAMTEFVQSPNGKLNIESTDGGYNFLTVDGRLIRSYEKDKWPKTEPFRIIAVTRQNLAISTEE